MWSTVRFQSEYTYWFSKLLYGYKQIISLTWKNMSEKHYTVKKTNTGQKLNWIHSKIILTLVQIYLFLYKNFQILRFNS